MEKKYPSRKNKNTQSLIFFAGGWSETLPLSSLPHPNLYLMNQFLGLSSIGGGRNTIYTVDRDQEGEEEQARDRRNVTIGYVVAQRGGGQGARAGDQKRICFIYMKVNIMMICYSFPC